MPTPVYYPSLVLNFKLRFDEDLTLIDTPVPVSVDDDVARGPTGPVSSSPVQPLITQKGPGNESFIMQRVPKSCSVELPGYRQASTFQATLDFRDLPVDPRTVRAAAVEVHLGTVFADQAGQGFIKPSSDGSFSSVLKTRTSSGLPNGDTLLGVYLVDEWHVDHKEMSSEIQIKGRDMRSILIDTPIDIAPGAQKQLLDNLDFNQPINEVVEKILEQNPLFQQFKVVVNPAEWADNTIPVVMAEDEAPRHRKGAKGKRKPRVSSGVAGGSGNMSFWDLITKVCYLVGGIPYFQGTDLCIRPARTIYDQARGPLDPVKNPTPFLGGAPRTTDFLSNTALTPPLRFRRLVYGRDVSSSSFNRKFAGFHKPRFIRCVGYNYDAEVKGETRLIEGMWPEATVKDDTKATKVAPGGQTAQQEILNIPVAGPSSPQKLKEMARAIYEEVGRGEIGGSIETANLASFGGNNQDPDLLRLRPGDGVEVLIDSQASSPAAPFVSTLTNFTRDSFSEVVQEIQQRIPDENLARVIVATARGQVQQLQKFFRVQTVKYNWSDNGIKVSFDFQNYFVPRNQVESASPTPGAAVAKSTPGKAAPKTGAGSGTPTLPKRG
jgi:hypothetical protein